VATVGHRHLLIMYAGTGESEAPALDSPGDAAEVPVIALTMQINKLSLGSRIDQPVGNTGSQGLSFCFLKVILSEGQCEADTMRQQPSNSL
jgi:hypothetical protein